MDDWFSKVPNEIIEIVIFALNGDALAFGLKKQIAS